LGLEMGQRNPFGPGRPPPRAGSAAVLSAVSSDFLLSAPHEQPISSDEDLGRAPVLFFSVSRKGALKGPGSVAYAW